MKKFLLILSAFVFLPCSIWAKEYKIRPGVIITKENIKKYLPALKKKLTQPNYIAAVNGIENGWITLPVIERKKIPLPDRPYPYGDATLKFKNIEKCRVGPNNELIGYKAGRPFPEVRTGAELAWNFKRRNHVDQGSFYGDFRLFGKSGRKSGRPERTFRWHLYDRWWMGRIHFPIMPEEPGNNGLIWQKEAIVIVEPFDVKGFIMLRIQYDSVDREDEVYSYIPAIRRVRRLTGSDAADPLLGSDYINDDGEVMRQKINSKMTFKILGVEDKLVPTYYTEKDPEPVIKGDCCQVDWEIRPFYILEIQMNDPEYIYSKRIIYCEQDHPSADSGCGMTYDQKGRFWRSLGFVSHGWTTRYNNVNYYCVGLYMNHLSGHSSQLVFDKTFGDPRATPKAFTIKYLLKDAH